MYEDFFGFERLPFNVTPDSEFIYYSEDHFEALSQILYGVQERKGFVAVTGPVGSGKTTLSRAFLQEVGDDTSTALILNSRMNSDELLHSIVDDFGLETPEDPTTKQLIDRVNEFLLSEFRDGRNVCVIIDESQNLSPEALENLRLLSNLETEKHKLLQIVLVGQPELNDLLNRSELRQLKQRINVWVTLSNLSREETEEYIRHRLEKAGNPAIAIQDPVFDRVYDESRGNPRSINLICDRTLLSAYVNEDKQIKEEHVEEALDNLSVEIEEDGQLEDDDAFVLERVTDSSSLDSQWLTGMDLGRSVRLMITVVLTVLVTASIMFAYGTRSTIFPLGQQTKSVSEQENSSQEETNSSGEATARTQQETTESKTNRQGRFSNDRTIETTDSPVPNPLNITPVSGDDSQIKTGHAPVALARFASLRLSDHSDFQKETLDFSGRIDSSFSFSEMIPEILPGQVVTLRQDTNQPRTYGNPGFLEWRDARGMRYVLYLPENGFLWDPLRGRLNIEENGFTGWTGYTKILTRATFNPSLLYQKGDSGKQVLELQQLINSVTNQQLPEEGRYGPKTMNAVGEFQEQKGLVVDGIAGPSTNLTLLQEAGIKPQWSRDEFMNLLKEVSR